MIKRGLLYLSSSSSKEITEKTSKVFGGFATPYTGNTKLIKLGRLWAGDNGSYSREFDEDKFYSFLDKMLPYKSTNLFIACPDEVYDAEKTLFLYKKHFHRIKHYGYSVALVTQDNLLHNDVGVYTKDDDIVPFTDIDWLFIGGSNIHKNAETTKNLIIKAKNLGIYIHVGRVNGRKRLSYFKNLGVHTVDGTHINFSPKIALQEIESWIKE